MRFGRGVRRQPLGGAAGGGHAPQVALGREDDGVTTDGRVAQVGFGGGGLDGSRQQAGGKQETGEAAEQGHRRGAKTVDPDSYTVFVMEIVLAWIDANCRKTLQRLRPRWATPGHDWRKGDGTIYASFLFTLKSREGMP